MSMTMKLALIAALTLCAFAASAAAAEEEWVVVGGDGSALGYDRTSVKKEAANLVSLRYAVQSATALPSPPSMPASTMLGFTGVMTINCQEKSARPGETTYFFAYGGERTVAAAPKATFEKFKPSDYQAYFMDVACNGRRILDSYGARGRIEALAALKRIAASAHVTNAGAKGWTYAMGDGARLLAVDTSSTKRNGDSVLQPEIAWMRKPQTTNGQTWRYYYLVTEYDCAKGKRRGNGPFRIYNDADQPVHEETIVDAQWETLSGPEASNLLEIACKSRKLAGLPSGSRAGMLARLKELAALQ
jgi:hypothetical protein